MKARQGDQVTLGKSGVTIARLGLGTGSNNGQVQRDLGAEGFRKLIHEAFDRGITYIDTADNYKTHQMVREAKAFDYGTMPPEVVAESWTPSYCRT